MRNGRWRMDASKTDESYLSVLQVMLLRLSAMQIHVYAYFTWAQPLGGPGHPKIWTDLPSFYVALFE